MRASPPPHPTGPTPTPTPPARPKKTSSPLPPKDSEDPIVHSGKFTSEPAAGGLPRDFPPSLPPLWLPSTSRERAGENERGTPPRPGPGHCGVGTSGSTATSSFAGSGGVGVAVVAMGAAAISLPPLFAHNKPATQASSPSPDFASVQKVSMVSSPGQTSNSPSHNFNHPKPSPSDPSAVDNRGDLRVDTASSPAPNAPRGGVRGKQKQKQKQRGKGTEILKGRGNNREGRQLAPPLAVPVADPSTGADPDPADAGASSTARGTTQKVASDAGAVKNISANVSGKAKETESFEALETPAEKEKALVDLPRAVKEKARKLMEKKVAIFHTHTQRDDKHTHTHTHTHPRTRTRTL